MLIGWAETHVSQNLSVAVQRVRTNRASLYVYILLFFFQLCFWTVHVYVGAPALLFISSTAVSNETG